VRNRLIALLLLLGVVVLLLWGARSLGPDRGPSGAATPAPGSRPARAEAHHSPPGSEVHANLADCPDITSLEQRFAELGAECATVLLAQDCILPEREVAPAVEQLMMTARDRLLERCSAISPDAFVVDCAGAPCFYAIKSGGIGGTERCVGERLPPPIDAGSAPVFQRWSVFPLEPNYPDSESHFDSPKSERRRAIRLAQLARNLRRQERSAHPQQAAAAGRCELPDVADLLSNPSCEALMAYHGCSASEFAVGPELVDKHLGGAEQLIDELLDSCPAFGDAPYVLDCDDIPCILAFPKSHADRLGIDTAAVTCGMNITDGESQYLRNRSDGPMVVVLPMFAAGGVGEVPQVVDRWVDRSGGRMSAAVSEAYEFE